MTAPILFDVPSSFTTLDLAHPTGIEDIDTLIAELRARNACYAAVFAEPPHRTGYFAITSVLDAAPDLDRIAAHLTGTLEVRHVELPCGPALAFTETTGRAVREHALLVHTDRTRIVAFTLATDDDRRRPGPAHLFAEILATVTFAHEHQPPPG